MDEERGAKVRSCAVQGGFVLASRLLPQRLNGTGNRDLMNKRLRILHLEDDLDFSDLVRVLLEKEAINAELSVVSSTPSFLLRSLTRSFSCLPPPFVRRMKGT